MAKLMTQEELDLHIAEASAALSSLMASLAASEQKENKKKSMLLAYWVKKYVTLIKREPKFAPKSIPRYKRGQVLNVDFGFRVGNELGGLHYAVVLDTKNAQSSSVITVVPLMSLKTDKFKPNDYTVALPDGVYVALYNKLSVLIEQAKEMIAESSRDDITPQKPKQKEKPLNQF